MRRRMILLLLVVLSSVGLVAQNAENVAFKWAFGALTGVGKEKSFVPIARDTVMRTGDEIKMLVELQRQCFVYVVHAAPNGDISLFFPYDFEQFDKDYEVNKNYYIPKGRDWITFDKSTGKERFYLLAANERLTDLESLITSYEKGDAAAKKSLSQKILDEIRDVRRKFRTTATLAEKPVTIGGNIRGMAESKVSGRKPDVATIVSEISASNFYSKSVTIDHR